VPLLEPSVWLPFGDQASRNLPRAALSCFGKSAQDNFVRSGLSEVLYGIGNLQLVGTKRIQGLFIF
jgi:hypothetical protein